MFSQKVDKPWGYEIILTKPNLPYTAKLLFIKTGEQTSLQRHDQKKETLTLVSGSCQIVIGTDQQSLTTTDMQINTGYTIEPNTIHQIVSQQDCLIFEASTPETGTTYRLKDKYGRQDESEEIRKSERQDEEEQ